LKDLALNNNLIQVGKKEQAAYIKPLMEWKFISFEKIGTHHIVSLTDEGLMHLGFYMRSK
jgi:hypothetical protein